VISFSCFLFGFAIPLAVFASPLLRFSVWLYNGLAGWVLPTPHIPRPEPEELAEAGARSHEPLVSDQVTTAPTLSPQSVTTIPTAESLPEEAVSTHLHVPAFKMAVFTLLVVLIATSIVAGFGKLLAMAVLEVVRGRGGASRTDFSTVYTIVEILLLPLGFLLLARMLQELLPADFVTACLVAALYLVLFVLTVLVLVGLLKLWFLFVGWLNSFYTVGWLPIGFLDLPNCAVGENLLDFPG
jgi:hypothetical protein